LLITPVFHPEPYYLRGLPFVHGMQARGFEVDVLTGFPNYPAGRLFPGYRQRFCQRETVAGVTITRVPFFLSHDASGTRRAVTYLSMSASMALQAPFRFRRPDIVHVNQGPATLYLPAECLRLLRGVPFLLDVQDLWPESVLDSGMLRGRGARCLLEWWCRQSYRRARHIITLSEGVRRVLLERRVPADKVTVLPNWCDTMLEAAVPARETVEDTHGLAGTFNIVYAGNFGALQALHTVLEAAARLRLARPSIRFVLLGSGVEEQALRRQAAQQDLDNVLFLPRQPPATLNRVFAFADAVLVHLKDSMLNRVGIPSKLQHALAVGRPVLLGACGASAELVSQAGAGYVFPPEDAGELAAAACRLADLPAAQREELGRRGRGYYQANLSFETGTGRLAELYRRQATPPRRERA
jgi:glycosyltransferase involved in cell wall biosynthesis